MADPRAAVPEASDSPPPASDLIRRIRAREVSCAEALERYLERIANGEPELRAWASFDPELARAQAAALDTLPAAELSRLPLAGLPVGVKDVFDTEALPTEYGSEIYRDHRPDRDAAIVVALRDAGAVVVGKTKTAELAWMHPADTRNPLDPQRTPGGSSSGSAAAVAADMVPLALGTQTGGSIIRPASFCGVVGYKPTFGLLSRDGVLPVSASLDTVGLLARHPEDVRTTTLAMLAGERRPTARSSLPVDLAAVPHDDGWRPQIGFVRGSWELIEPEGRDAFDAAISAVEAAGAELDELLLADELAELAQAQATVQQFETARSLAREAAKTAGPRVSLELAGYIAGAAAISTDDYLNSRRLADERRWLWHERIAELDVLLVPSTLGPPPTGLGSTGDSLPCRPWTLLGMPCVAVPIAWTKSGLPMGIQLVGALQRDGAALDAASWLLDRIGPRPASPRI